MTGGNSIPYISASRGSCPPPLDFVVYTNYVEAFSLGDRGTRTERSLLIQHLSQVAAVSIPSPLIAFHHPAQGAVMKLFAIVLFAAFLATGCSDQSEVTPADSKRTVPQPLAKPPTPFKGRLRVQLVNASPCATGTTVEGEGNGPVSHMGLSTVDLSHCLSPAGAFTDGFGTLTAVSGGEVFFLYSGANGPVSGDSYSITASGVVVGGSGRFQNASGLVTLEGTGYTNGPPAQLVLDGVIFY